MNDIEYTDLVELKGHTLVDVEVSRATDVIRFIRSDGRVVRMEHFQDCCESVVIEDICGDITDLVGAPLEVAEEASCDNPQASESGTFTFYRFRTIKGSVDIRWDGQSNGYYSESVSVYLEHAA